MESFGVRQVAAAATVTLGLGLSTVLGSAVAGAQETDDAAIESGAMRTPRSSAAEPRERQAPAATHRSSGPATRSARPSPGPQPAAARQQRRAAIPLPALTVAPEAAPAVSAPASRPAAPAAALRAAAAPAEQPTAAASSLSASEAAATASKPSGAASGAAMNPLDVLTAALAMISREINRLFFNRTPTANPVQHGLAAPGVVTGTIGGWDPEDDPLAYSVTGLPALGSVVVDAAGGYTYTAGAELAATGGTDSFTVTVRDTGFHLNFWTPTSISVPVTVTVAAAQPGPAARPAISIADLAVAEGHSTTSHFMFTARLNTSSKTPVSVSYATSDGTAVAGLDYFATAGTLTFAPGVMSQVIHVGILGDTIYETDETFLVILTNAVGATIADSSAVGTIIDDDIADVLTPGLSISDIAVTEPRTGTMAPGFLHTRGNQILDSAGQPVQLSGVNWFGLESSTGAPHGLWTRGYTEMIDQMAAAGFNTIRLPYASETLHTSSAPNGIDFSKNPELRGLTSLEVMDAVIDYAGRQGMRVILDHHRSGFGSGTSGNGLWYDAQYTEDAWVADWAMLAGRYRDNPTVIGFDLHNEPYNGTWGGGGANDWVRAAERAGNAALAVNPDLLIFVEGVGTYQGQSYWWGGNLMGVADRPIILDVPGRVVYSPHDYPNSVYPQPWFSGSNFGAGLPAKFRQMWGYIYEENIAPVYIGEFGTKLSDPKDIVWLEAITSYISGDFDNNGTIDIPAGTEDISWTFWSWNPNSGDTGGILADDWTTINQNKMAYLTSIQFTGGATSSVATFTVTLTAPSDRTVTVQYSTLNGTAAAGADYTATSGTLTFSPGQTSARIVVPVLPDGVVEGTETFFVVLSNPSGATLSDGVGVGSIADGSGQQQRDTPALPETPDTPVMPNMRDMSGGYADLMSFGMFHGSDHTGMNALEGGRTPITTEALVAYNDLRRFAGLAPVTLADVGTWAFANGLTNNAEAWNNDLQGVGLFYAMQGAKVGWMADDAYDPQIVADIERTARLGSARQVMAIVAEYGHPGFSDYLLDNGYDTAFVNTLKMETHWAGWMHDRANGRLLIEGSATAHDVNHLTVLSHDQMRPFMNDTWDWPQWPALEVSDKRVIEYFQSMVTLGNPLGENLTSVAVRL